MKEKFWILLLGLCSLTGVRAAELLVEAEAFGRKGGWVVPSAMRWRRSGFPNAASTTFT